MERNMTGERYNANLTPSFRRHWRFFVLGGIVYCFAVLVLLRWPMSYEGIEPKVLLFAGEFLVRGVAYLLFGAVALLLGRVPLMLPLLVWEWMGFRFGLISVVALYSNGQYVQMGLLLMMRFGLVFFPCLCASITCWEETKAFLRKRRRLFLSIGIRRETLALLAAASFVAALLETLIL